MSSIKKFAENMACLHMIANPELSWEEAMDNVCKGEIKMNKQYTKKVRNILDIFDETMESYNNFKEGVTALKEDPNGRVDFSIKAGGAIYTAEFSDESNRSRDVLLDNILEQFTEALDSLRQEINKLLYLSLPDNTADDQK